MEKCLKKARSRVTKFMKEKFMAAGIRLDEAEVGLLMDEIEEDIWDVMECYRSIEEVKEIVDGVRAGESVNVPYYDPDIDDNPYITRAKW